MKSQPVGDGEVHLWWASCDKARQQLPSLIDLLDGEERLRADRFRVSAARERFVAARAMTRLLLGRYAETPASAITLNHGARGKPRLSHPAPASPLQFNLSHSGDIAVVGLATTELGVDVEALRPVPNADRLARRFCSRFEQEWLAAQPQQELESAFLTLWTCKESYLKAVGVGIAMPLREVEVQLDPLRLLRISGDPREAAGWTLLRADLPEPAVSTVAVRGKGWRLVVREFDWAAGV
jgi:4'-phosphopantetheinyl transferase